MRRIWGTLTLQNKHLLFFAVVILAFLGLSSYIVYRSTEYTDVFQRNLDSYFTIHQFQQSLTASADSLADYIRSGDSEALERYGATNTELWVLFSRLDRELPRTYPARFHLRATRYGLDAYAEAGFEAISERLSGSREFYLTFDRALRISGYIDGYVDELFRLRLNEGSERYSIYRSSAENTPRTVALGVGAIAAVLVAFAVLFSRTVTRPLHQLALSSRRMAAGQLDPPEVLLPPGDEVAMLADSFNTMSANIRALVVDLRDKQELQRRLHEEELKNLSMERSLREAQLIGLQTQINPHFLFNTLNAIARTAEAEGAPTSAALIRSLSRVFRYLLRNPTSMVPLQSELSLVEAYMQIQVHRFGGRLRYRLECDVPAQDYKVPVLVLQPLVENAVRYGIEPAEEGGEVVVSATIEDDQLLLSVVDDGVGMEGERAERLARATGVEEQGVRDPEDTSGIGIHNVVKRLALMYQGGQAFTIVSAPGEGTRVNIRIPLLEEASVQTAYS
ncbi:MAG: histidine kinase [Alkalispirochaetaceae bacterium]